MCAGACVRARVLAWFNCVHWCWSRSFLARWGTGTLGSTNRWLNLDQGSSLISTEVVRGPLLRTFGALGGRGGGYQTYRRPPPSLNYCPTCHRCAVPHANKATMHTLTTSFPESQALMYMKPAFRVPQCDPFIRGPNNVAYHRHGNLVINAFQKKLARPQKARSATESVLVVLVQLRSSVVIT